MGILMVILVMGIRMGSLFVEEWERGLEEGVGGGPGVGELGV